MRRICKANIPPASLTAFRQKHPAGWEEIHRPENMQAYSDSLCSCIADQENLCGYTEIFLKPQHSHIDHYIKRSIDNRLTFSWENMIAAVIDSRFGANWKDAHITEKDYDRCSMRYTNILNPVTDNLGGRFVYSTDGMIEPAEINDDLARNTIAMFNLNEDSLKSQRRRVMMAARDMVKGGIPEPEVREMLKTSGFSSAVDYELRSR
jgi:uncharacterized protein (TIGR02646 family)